jgi:hypothetical protein
LNNKGAIRVIRYFNNAGKLITFEEYQKLMLEQ